METDGRTDPELIYWISKFILMQNNKPFSQLGYMSNKMRPLAESQDKIGWRNFTEGYISSHFYNIQRFHLLMSNNFLNGSNWTKQFISKLLQITHSQWIYHNISLHNRRQGYLHNKQSEDLLQEITELSGLSPNEVPESCQFLLEVNFTDLTSSHLETQRYWTLAMNAALTARQLERKRGARIKKKGHRVNRKSQAERNSVWPPSNSKFDSTGCTDPQTPTAQMISTMAAKQLSPHLLLNVPIHHQLSPPLNPTSASLNQIAHLMPHNLCQRLHP